MRTRPESAVDSPNGREARLGYVRAGMIGPIAIRGAP